MLYLLEIELQTVVSYCVGIGHQTGSSAGAVVTLTELVRIQLPTFNLHIPNVLFTLYSLCVVRRQGLPVQSSWSQMCDYLTRTGITGYDCQAQPSFLL